MKNILILTLAFYTFVLSSQAGWTGTFTGQVNGDNAVMVLKVQGTKVQGTLKDTYQTFKISGDINGNRLAGDAVEESLGLEVGILGELKGDDAFMKLVVVFLGQTSETPFQLRRQNKSGSATKSEPAQQSSIASTPAGANLDPRIVGTWTKNETYNSGYGDNFMGANFSQSMTFMGDGRLAEGASSASISGSNYSGKSSGGGSNVLEGVTWYTKGKSLYLRVKQNGQQQDVMLGSYYVENGKMLITGQDGTKLLLIKN
ncbi:MAG: hypothetical protein KDC49_11870 [Saprospiraceae bacterium]|nr:hypothetical protein [Saprospiraceae bacterium]